MMTPPMDDNHKAPTDRGEPIPAARLIDNGEQCSFCRGPDHFGFCDAMRAHNEEAAKTISQIQRSETDAR